MTEVLLIILVLVAVLVVVNQSVIGMIINLAAFSVISSLCFMFAASPDAALAEAVTSVFMTVIFIVALEKYYKPEKPAGKPSIKAAGIIKRLLPVLFTALLLAVFAVYSPGQGADTALKQRYITRFSSEIGGENAVTAVYLGYRVYDTLFETLLLLVSVAAVAHLSRHGDFEFLPEKRSSHIPASDIALGTIRIISPILALFGIYIILNGHISPGGGFQGGVIVSSFFVCRYLIYDISDIRIKAVRYAEKVIFVLIVLFVSLFIYRGPLFSQNTYLILLNSLIGVKVAFGFLVIFYRFINFERR